MLLELELEDYVQNRIAESAYKIIDSYKNGDQNLMNKGIEEVRAWADLLNNLNQY